MANFEENVMVALYWGGEIISEMSGFRYSEGARMIVSMSISTSYIELVAMLHEKIRTNSENIQMDISGKYPCSFQAQNYGFAMLSRPHFAYTATPTIHQSLDASPNEHEYQSYDEGLSSQGHIKGGHKQYEISLSELWQFQEPQAFHRFYVRHLKSNFQSYFPNRNLSDLMWNAASTHQVRKFEALMWEIREENEEAYEYLMQFPLDKWMISHDDGKRWGVLTTNLLESFNGLLKKARRLPITATVRLSLEKIVERYTRRSQTAHQLVEQKELWTSRFKVKWEKNYESSKKHFVFYWNISTGIYEVRSIQVDGTGGNPHRVSVSDKKYDCEKGANLHFPCSHVMKVTERMGGLARNFVSEHFTIENYVATCYGSFSQVGHKAYWPSPNFIMRSNEFYRRSNRQRTTRVPNEMDHGPAVYGRACGLCKKTGHDRRRCPTHNQT
ncbi:hypothetical protein T459_08033 [Capsicum annuum]|uniref:SWIM-type domain-containing protein n=1 Tax=Capsicum annuum TaxID=4072 RepID=A0A2G2ZVC7_CAPAN|nr:hypothetical protein T459_08033 [Capsicum annuum]